MTTETKIHIVPTGDLYHRYYSQTNPQPCYIKLDCKTGRLCADWNAEIGTSVPISVWHGHDQRWSIPALHDHVADELLEELAPLCQRIVDGYECEWDGSNHVARFTPDADAARDEIDGMLYRREWDDSEVIAVWDAGDWLGLDDYGITAKTSDEELDAKAEEIEAEAEAEANARLEGTRKALEWIREKKRRDEE